MTVCKHTPAETDTATFADGLCPLCLAADVNQLWIENEKLREGLRGLRARCIEEGIPHFVKLIDATLAHMEATP